MNKETIISLIDSYDKDEEFYNSPDYPNHKKAFLVFLDENNIRINEEDLEETVGNPYIDDDGYPGFNATISIPKISLTLSIIAYHHRGWDFFFDGVSER